MDAVIDAVKDCKIRAIVCNRNSVDTIMSKIKEMPSLKIIIYTDDMVAPNDKTKTVTKGSGDVKVFSFDDFVESGDCAKYPPVPPKPETCAVIMFTSGSTGKPKGVVVTHANLLAAVAGGFHALGVRLGEEVYLGYLPLAHILELMAEVCQIGFGCTICYADPKTLTQTGAYPIGALEQYAPTMMAGVPKIWDVIKKGAQAKIALGSPVAQWLVATAFAFRGFALRNGFDTPFFNALVFKKFSGIVGGRLRLAISGGGPLNSEVQIFVRTAFGCPLFQGYGLTETCAGLSVQAPSDMRCGIAGIPLASCEVKLESCAEIMDKRGNGYLITDRKDVAGNFVFGRGEVLTRGNSVTKGYYMMQSATDEAWEADGWFHTGDIGQFMADGSIRIVDRKKNLVKLKGGEYIAVENMEMSYGNSSFVDAINGGICCYGDGDMDRPVALMQLNEPIVMAWAKNNGVGGNFDQLKGSKQLYDVVLKDLQNEGKKAGLSNLEKLTAVTFLTTPWTPENGCLTAANKLQRRVVIDTFESEFLEVKKKGIY
jgi:long-chain acyl-CoA synthetase